MPSITLKNFRGVNLRPSNWVNGYSRYAKSVEVFGLGDIPTKISYPGVLQGARETSAMAEAASPSAVTEIIQDFGYYKGSAFAIGRDSPGRIYRNTGGITGTWQYVSSILVSGTGNNLMPYGGNLYYMSNTYVGQYDNTTGNANWNAFTDTDGDPRPAKVFAGSLYIGHGRSIAKYDGTTFTDAKLSLPSGFLVRSIEAYNDRLFISGDNTQFSQIFIWDGVSTTYEQAIEVLDESSALSLVVSNGILWLVGNRGTSVDNNPVYVFDGNFIKKVFDLPVKRSSSFQPPNALAAYKNGILVCSSEDSSAGYEDGIGGVWLVSKAVDEDVYHATLAFAFNSKVTGIDAFGIITIGTIVYIGVRDGVSFEIHTLYDDRTAASGIWSSLPIDANDPTKEKLWNSLELQIEQDETSWQNVTVAYRVDNATSFTTLTTLTSSTEAKRKIGIRQSGKVIEVRLTMASSSSVMSVKIHSLMLNYSVASR